MDAIFDGDYYSESEKVKIAARTFDDEVFEWWEELKAQRRFYDEKPITSWYDLRAAMRKQFRQNNYEEFLFQGHDNSDRETRLDRINKGAAELQEGMDKIESLFSQLKESSPIPQDQVGNYNNVKTPTKRDESLKPENVEIKKLEEPLTEDMKIEEDDARESKDFNQDFLVEDGEDQQQSEVVYLLSCKNVIFIVHTSPTVILVSLMFQPLYTVSMRGETELMRRKKKKKKRNGKRVKEKLFVLDIFQVTMARI